MSINSNYIKPDISYIICTYLLFITILFKGVLLGFDIMDRISPVLEILDLHVLGNNPTILLIKQCQKFKLYIYICYLPGNYRTILFIIQYTSQGIIYIIYRPFHIFCIFNKHHNLYVCSYIQIWVVYFSPYGSKTYIIL